MRIVETIRQLQQESISRRASPESRKSQWGKKKEENAQKTREILEESGVKAALIEIRDKLTKRGPFGLFDIGQLREFEGEGSRIGGIKLVWDREEIHHAYCGFGYPPIIRWKEIRIHVTSRGDLLLEKEREVPRYYYGTWASRETKIETFYQIIDCKSWQEDRSLVEKELAEYFQNPMIVEDRPIIDVGHHAGKLGGIQRVIDVWR